MIFRLTAQHAIGLAKFVSLYKALVIVQRRMHGGKPGNFDTFFAGLIGGYAVFGERTPVNEQVCFTITFIKQIFFSMRSSRLFFTLSHASSQLSLHATARNPSPRQLLVCPPALWNPMHINSLSLRHSHGEQSCGCLRTKESRYSQGCGAL